MLAELRTKIGLGSLFILVSMGVKIKLVSSLAPDSGSVFQELRLPSSAGLGLGHSMSSSGVAVSVLALSSSPIVQGAVVTGNSQNAGRNAKARARYASTKLNDKEALLAAKLVRCAPEKLQVNIYDGTGSLDVTVFGHQVEELHLNAVKCLELYNTPGRYCSN